MNTCWECNVSMGSDCDGLISAMDNSGSGEESRGGGGGGGGGGGSTGRCDSEGVKDEGWEVAAEGLCSCEVAARGCEAVAFDEFPQ